jgi:hypothetical protein
LRQGTKMNRAPPLRRRKLAPRREVGAYASLKKMASGVIDTMSGVHLCTYVQLGLGIRSYFN